jgi:hypothetical protein
MKGYRSALDRMKRREDQLGRTIWVEEEGHEGKPRIFYRYDGRGRLMKYTGTLFGYTITAAEYTRFGEETQIEVEKRKPRYYELR